MLCAMFCIIMVLPDLGGETIRPRWPLPTGAARSMTRAVRSSVLPLPCSMRRRSLGNSGVRFSKGTLFLAFSGRSKLISLTFNNAK